jgi:hypothetical protein
MPKKGRADLDPLSSERKSRNAPTCIRDTSGGNHGSRNGVCDLGISAKVPVRDPSAECMKEPRVAYRFKTRSDDHIDACLFEKNRFVGRSCYSDRRNSLCAAFVKNFFRGTPQMKLKTGTWHRARRAHGLQTW